MIRQKKCKDFRLYIQLPLRGRKQLAASEREGKHFHSAAIFARMQNVLDEGDR